MGESSIEMMFAVLSASVLGVALFFAIRGVGGLARRQWRSGFNNVGVALGLTLLGVVMVGVIGSSIAEGEEVDPSSRGQVLGEFIATVMNCGAVIGLLALGAGLFDAVWRKRRAPKAR